jgi:hypothetical protein
MATTTELLRLVIDADAKGAVQGLEAVGASADKNLSRMESKLDRVGAQMTTWGAGMVAGSAVVGVGLYKAAQAFDAAEQNQRKFDSSIRNSSQTYSEGGKALSDYAQSLQQVTAADGDAIVGMQSVLIQFGLTEEQVKTLTPLVVDLSRKMGVDLDDAAKAVGKSVDGSTGGLRRYGISIDEADAKTDAFGATVEGLRSTVGGFAEEEGKSFSGQIEIMKNNLGDIQESVGKGAIDVIGGLAGAAAGGAKALTEMNPALAESVGKIGAIGALTVGAVGGITVAAGQLIKFRDVLTTVGADGTRSLNGLGRAMKGVGLAAATLAVTEAAFTLINESAGRAKESAAALDDLTLAFQELEKGAKGGSKQVVDSFADLVGAEQNTLRIQNLWQEFGAEVSIVGTDVKADIEQVQRAFDQLGDAQGPQAQLDLLDAMEQANGALDRASDQYKTNKKFIDDNRAAVEKHAKAVGVSKQAQADATAENAEAAEQIDNLKVALDSYGARLKLLAVDQDAAKAGAQGFADALDMSTVADDAIGNAAKMGDQMRDFGTQIAALPKDIDLTKLALGRYTTEQAASVRALVEAGDANRTYLAGLVEQGETADQVQMRAAALRDEYVRQAQQLGLNDEQTQQYLETLGLTPDQVNTAIMLSGAEEARAKLQLLRDFIQNLGPGVDSLGRPQIEIAVAAQVAEGGPGSLENAAALYSAWVTDVQDGAINNPIVQAVISNTDPASAGIDAWRAGLAGGDPATVPVGIGLTPESQAILANPSDPNFLARLAGSFGAGSFGASVDVSADTSQASTDLSTWKNGAEADDANVPVNAGTVGASAQMDAWRKRQAGSPVNVPVRILGGVDLWRNLTGQGQTQPKPTSGATVPGGPPWYGSNGVGGLDRNIWTAFAAGGVIAGVGNTDSVPALLTPGEFVVTKEAAKRVGYGLLSSLNDGEWRGFAAGGVVGPTAPPVQGRPVGGAVVGGNGGGISISVERIEASTPEATPTQLVRAARRAQALLG